MAGKNKKKCQKNYQKANGSKKKQDNKHRKIKEYKQYQEDKVNQHDLTTPNNMDTISLSTYRKSKSGESTTDESRTRGSTSENHIQKQRKREHHNEVERGRRATEKIALNNLKDSVYNATGVRPRTEEETYRNTLELIKPKIDDLAKRVTRLKLQNSRLSHQERILKSKLNGRKLPKLPPLPRSPERPKILTEFLAQYNLESEHALEYDSSENEHMIPETK